MTRALSPCLSALLSAGIAALAAAAPARAQNGPGLQILVEPGFSVALTR